MAHNNTTDTVEQELQNNGFLSEDSMTTLDISLNVVLGSIIAIFGLIGNALSFAVYSHDKRSLVASLLFKSLSIIDSVVLISNIIKVCVANTTFGYLIHNFALRYALYECTYCVLQISRALSIWLTVLIAGVRYIAIQYPLHMSTRVTHSSIRFVIATLSFVVVLYFTPCIYVVVMVLRRIQGGCQINRTPCVAPDEYEIIKYHPLISDILITIIPLLLLIILSILLITAYHKSVKMARQMTGNNCEEQNQTTLSVIMVVVVLVICQSFSFAYEVGIYLMGDYNIGGPWHIVKLLRYFFYGANSAVNFIIYSICSKSFRVKLYSFITKQFSCQSS